MAKAKADPGRAWRWPALVGFFLVASGILVASFLSLSVLYDTDSYYHLAVAREYAASGSMDSLPWARFSLMFEGFGDKELLFHYLLAPFSSSTAGGRVALALIVACILTLLAGLAWRFLGAWALFLPLVLVATSAEWVWRLVRLRPELLALVLFLLAVDAMGRHAYRRLGFIAALFALSYTAFHALLGLCGLLFLFRALARRQWHWGLVLYPTVGVGLALLLHPQFPQNLVVWWVQSVEYFRFKALLDVGPEIGPQRSDELLLHSLGFFLALVAVWRSSRKGEPKSEAMPQARDLADSYTLAAMVFGLLYLLMRRFVIYFIPFASLALLFELARRGRRIGGSTRLPGRGSLPLPVTLVLCVLATSPELLGLGRALSAGDGRELGPERHWQELARSLPAGARTASTWGSAQAYLYFAPSARFLNVLDPVFMALPHPEVYRAQRAVFEGSEPDVPLVVSTLLESDYLAWSKAAEGPRLAQRIAEDPRARVLLNGQDVLVELEGDRNGDFVLDWEVRPGEGAPWRPYPRHATELGRSIEGFVDLRRLSSEPICTRFRHRLELAEEQLLDLRLAPYGPTSFSIDGELVATVSGDPEAVIGRGLRLPRALGIGGHVLEVTTCSAGGGSRLGGFYLLLQARPLEIEGEPKVATAGAVDPERQK